MADYDFATVYKNEYITRNWETIRRIRKPVIAAVAGYALGGGCELGTVYDSSDWNRYLMKNRFRFGKGDFTDA
ncbi:hypothetical protein ACH51_06600 [Ralstonia solanacearum]|nr:hypothetical protein ACH51_06600 [Ralstonia solanacearum]